MQQLSERLVVVPIPALIVKLVAAEKAKASHLPEIEVLDIRDNAVSVMLKLSDKKEMDKKRGYLDLNPDNVWLEWCEIRDGLVGSIE